MQEFQNFYASIKMIIRQKKKNQADRKTFLQVFGDDIKLERQALVKI